LTDICCEPAYTLIVVEWYCMDISNIKEQKDSTRQSSAPSSRERFNADYAHKVSAEDAIRQQARSERNRAAARRQATNALYESLDYEKAVRREKMQAGADKMVRSVIQKESTQRSGTADGASQNSESNEQASRDYMQAKINTAYRQAESESRQSYTERPETDYQQRRAVDRYQQSNQKRPDHNLDLVIK